MNLLHRLIVRVQHWLRPAAAPAHLAPSAPHLKPAFLPAVVLPGHPAPMPARIGGGEEPVTVRTPRVLHRTEGRPPELAAPLSPEAQTRLVEELRTRHDCTYRDAWEQAKRARPELFPFA